jgi:asparagine synthase (glutamine-hydrolysing)
MCGIAGSVSFDTAPAELEAVESMCEAMRHRGPDDRGLHGEPGVAFGMQRLSIIDVAGGHQPIANEDGSVIVILNGEIYNYLELRDRLTRSGHTFSTHSDTEVLVHLYEEHGARLVDHLRGMFAFAIWDRRSRTLLLGRDRVGKKPLFWTRLGRRIVFASELSSLLAHRAVGRSPSMHAIDAFLALQYVPHPLSAVEGAYKLPPASTLVADAGGVRVDTYWSLDYSRKRAVPDAEEQLLALLDEATRVRLMSEVPLGAFLSGGIDSSAVVASMAAQTTEPVKTFSIGFRDAAFDESQHARLVASQFGTDHHELVVEPSALELLPRLARHYGEPFADPSAIPSFYLAEMASQHVTVALNGDGGDESFAGYNRYHYNLKLRAVTGLPGPLLAAMQGGGAMLAKGRMSERLGRRVQRVALSPSSMYVSLMSAFDERRRTALLTPEFERALGGQRPEQMFAAAWSGARCANEIDRMLCVDVATYLPGDLLVKMDIATMAHSLEARSPFLDHKLMEFAAALPAHLKLDGANGKAILKRALARRLPATVLDRPKMGFGVPLGRWFREELRALPREILLDPASLRRGYFRPAAVESLIDEHQGGKADHALRLWVLIQLEMWHREVLEAPSLARA